MPKIRHVAIRTSDPKGVAEFYKKVFDMKEVGLARMGYYLSDGYITLAILSSIKEPIGDGPRDQVGYSGIDHLGFQVESMEDISTALEENGATPMNQRIDMHHPDGTETQTYYEVKYRGPDDQVIDVTESGWIY